MATLLIACSSTLCPYAKGGTTLFGLTYSYGTSGSNDGLISGITDNVQSGRSVSYTYDSLARLSTALTSGSSSYPQWGLQWTYDRYANRTQQQVTNGSGPSNLVTVSATTNQLMGSPYAYDLSGNMTNDGFNTLVYDAENRATSATNSSSSGAYTYDGNGLRVTKCVASCTSSTRYIFSGSKVIAEYASTASPSAPTIEYIYAGTTLIASEDNTSTYRFYQRDHLSNRVVTDINGNVLEQLGHYPYGESWYNSSGDKLLFTSYERDAESGNDYAQARYYVSRLGRFSSVDPLSGSTSDPQSLNRYVYVRDNPTVLVDPSGACGELIETRRRKLHEELEFGGMLLLPSELKKAIYAALAQDPYDDPIVDCIEGGGGGEGGGTGISASDITPPDLGPDPSPDPCAGDPTCGGIISQQPPPLPPGPTTTIYVNASLTPDLEFLNVSFGGTLQFSGGGGPLKNPCGVNTVLTASTELQQQQIRLAGIAVAEVSIANSGDVNGFNLVVGLSPINISDVTLPAGGSVLADFNGRSLAVAAPFGNITLNDPTSSWGASISALTFSSGSITGLSGSATYNGYPIPFTAGAVQKSLNGNSSLLNALGALAKILGKCLGKG